MSTLASEGPTRAISCRIGCIAGDWAITSLTPSACITRVCASSRVDASQRPSEIALRAQDRQQPLVVPRLLDEVARPATHRFDGEVHRCPTRS